jgi:hypothetical protein
MDSITPCEILRDLSVHFGTRSILLPRWRLMGIRLPAFGLANLEAMRSDHWIVMDEGVVHSFQFQTQYVQNVSAGELLPHVLSEEIPKNEEG